MHLAYWIFFIVFIVFIVILQVTALIDYWDYSDMISLCWACLWLDVVRSNDRSRRSIVVVSSYVFLGRLTGITGLSRVIDIIHSDRRWRIIVALSICVFPDRLAGYIEAPPFKFSFYVFIHTSEFFVITLMALMALMPLVP